MSTTIVIPCYNEAQRLAPAEFLRFADAWPGRFLMVDDGSTDDTRRVLDALREQKPQSFEVLALERNRGKAEAVRRGLLHAIDSGAGFVGYWDADLATPLDTIADFERLMAQHPEVVLLYGSRIKLAGNRIERHLLRHYIGRVFATAASVILRIPIYDTQCGAKLLRVTPELRRLFEKRFLTRWAFDVEIIARFLGHESGSTVHGDADAIYECAVPRWRDVPGSKIRWGDMFKAPLDMLRIAMHYR